MAEYPQLYECEGLAVELYDRMALLEGFAVAGDLEFYVEEALRSGGPVLELATGTGRVAWPIAEAGIGVVGLDLSHPMLACADAKAAGYPESVRRRARFLEGDMRGFDLGERFRLAIIPLRGFQALCTPAEQQRCLAACREHLVPGGRLIIDFFDPRLEYCVPGAPPLCATRLIEGEGRPTVEVTVFGRKNDPVTQLFTETWRLRTLAADGSTLAEEMRCLTLRWTFRYEARYLFELAGFRVVAEYSDFRRSPPAYGREQVWVLEVP